MHKMLLKILFSKMAYFMLLWDRQGRPFSRYTIQSAHDHQFVGVWIYYTENEWVLTNEWLNTNKDELGYTIVQQQ